MDFKYDMIAIVVLVLLAMYYTIGFIADGDVPPTQKEVSESNPNSLFVVVFQDDVWIGKKIFSKAYNTINFQTVDGIIYTVNGDHIVVNNLNREQAEKVAEDYKKAKD